MVLNLQSPEQLLADPGPVYRETQTESDSRPAESGCKSLSASDITAVTGNRNLVGQEVTLYQRKDKKRKVWKEKQKRNPKTQ